MKIVIISPFQKILPRGIERFSYSIANAMAKMGHEIIIYVWKNKKDFDWGYLNNNVSIKEFPSLRYYQRIWIGYYYNIQLRKDNPDLVLINFLYHGELRLSNRWNYIYVLHSPVSQIKNRYEFIKKNIKKFENLKFVAVSNMVKREAKPYLQGKQCEVIFNGVDLKLFSPKNKVKNYKLNLITVGAYEERKGIHYMINALASYPNKSEIIYNIFGSGPMFLELKRLITFHNLEKQVIINEPTKNINEFYAKNDVFVLLSKGEAMPIAPLEAMASGLALLVSNYEPYPEFVDSSFGYMLDPKDFKKIHFVLDELFKKEKLDQLKINARLASQKFSWQKTAKAYLEI